MPRGLSGAHSPDKERPTGRPSSADQPTVDMALVLSIFQTKYVAHLLLALIEGPQSFSALLGQTGIASSGTLSARLRDLQRWQLVTREGKLYALLPAGRASFSVLRQMELWGQRRAAGQGHADYVLLQRTGSLAIIYALMAAPLRVRDLSEQVRLVSRRSLLHRLQELTEAGYLRRQGESTAVFYSLTERGQTLRPVMDELTVWWSMYRALKPLPEARQLVELDHR
ncbi:winged helix-turn-helix transcriptional regulator [Deinococcus koreensis]|uniref:HTH hxlR-type domain-containing protein n=1 Tax=Deinococcus koreensis TaxID=2054903 RepID=A0A2K3USJ3_9DEIO|nr:winged helix-turn-helix transcriptional regulator [Deinococcus koreensis]PNY79511.1 hypothetical protein CVO96_18950 [Deinococcus koreensis]